MAWTEDDIAKIITNPVYAITLSPTLFGEHEPVIEREQWIAANAQAVREKWVEAWLADLLDVLETGEARRGQI